MKGTVMVSVGPEVGTVYKMRNRTLKSRLMSWAVYDNDSARGIGGEGQRRIAVIAELIADIASAGKKRASR